VIEFTDFPMDSNPLWCANNLYPFAERVLSQSALRRQIGGGISFRLAVLLPLL
jgi:hypothetical protein